ncbi:ground-like domain protein [Cooperia oncophora]
MFRETSNGSGTSCSSETVGTIIEQSMASSVSGPRELIFQSLLNHYERDVLVVCTPEHLNFSFTDGAEYCSKTAHNITCYGFVF